MDNQRIILFLALAIVVLFMWEAWVENTNPPVPTVVQQSSPVLSPPVNTENTVPSSQEIPVVATDVPTTTAPDVAVQNTTVSDQRIRVVTDVLDMDIESLGGDLRRAFLLKYPVNLQEKQPFPFMDDKLPQLFIAQSGFIKEGNSEAPNHNSVYTAEKTEYRLTPGQDELRVPLVWKSSDGTITVTKTYVFHRADYLIDVIHEVKNNSDQAWNARLYRQFQRTEYDSPNKSRLLYTFTGGAISTPENTYEKIDFNEMIDWKAEQSYTKGGWIAMMEHYFLSAWVPGANEVNHMFTRVISDTRHVLGISGEEKQVAAHSSEIFDSKLYVGPKDQDRLKEISPNLRLTVDYGFLTIIAQPLFWLLKLIHEYVGNWGWTIIFLTLLIKLAFYKLSEASYRSMANMRKVSPKFQAIRERYGDDRQRMSQAMMELYKTEKVNPMSGCWPMLVQIPVFISLYWVLLESVEIRQAPFMLWIQDLSSKDPYYILPLLMGASMFIQQKLSANPSLDPMHQKIMQYLPIVFTLFFMLFPAGLVLYWVVNSVLSILQQWYIMRKIDKASS